MSARELDAAGVTDPALRASYENCRQLNAAHGRTYFLATQLLPLHKRPSVPALYGFARYADEIVDDLASTLTPAQKTDALTSWAARALDGSSASIAGDPVLPAFHDTLRRWDIPPDYVRAFLHSMAMDLTVTGYPTFDDLMVYVYGSAAVIGLQMVPVLEPLPGMAGVAGAYAHDLGVAFQLANFIRDVGEDIARGRVYLPQEDLDAFGVTREHLARGVVDGPIRRLLAFEIARTREYFRAAHPGIRLLHPASRPCMETAFTLYGGILDAVEEADYQVLRQRVSVGIPRRITVAGPAWIRAVRARRIAA
jgi:phytoene synthase